MEQTKQRCGWCVGDPLYEAYHDLEWGVPVYDDQTLFEFLILETFQAGLSWVTILRKRENFRNAFEGFDYTKIANYDATKFDSLLINKGIYIYIYIYICVLVAGEHHFQGDRRTEEPDPTTASADITFLHIGVKQKHILQSVSCGPTILGNKMLGTNSIA